MPLQNHFLNQSTKYAISYKNNDVIAYNADDVSALYFQKKDYDSAMVYARKALGNTRINSIKIKASERMFKIFEMGKNTDSIYKYYRMATSAKDVLYSVEKNRDIQSLAFHEQLREQEIEAEKMKIEEERRENIQYALIGLGLVSFLIVFILLSRSFIANPKFIRFFGVIALLLIFEFLNLVLHPFFGHLTHHSPFLMLLALSGMAAILVPLHHKIEHWAIHKLIEKNKEIRLSGAKKTIEKLKAFDLEENIK